MDKMPRLSNRLAALTLRFLPPGKHLDGAGLYLIKSDVETGRWMLRYRQFGRRRNMGLGGWPRVALGDARRAADAARPLVDDGHDPISARRLKSPDYGGGGKIRWSRVIGALLILGVLVAAIVIRNVA